jgi:hypothetical protein
MKRIITLLYISFISVSALFISSCTTDFELNAEYDEIPIIFGILDQSVDTQFIKINKSFIGDGDNTTYAAINDSSLYTNVVARVEEYIGGTINRTFPLEEMWVNNLDEGIFYTDVQKVYFFVPTAPLNEDATYKLIVDVSEEAQPIEAETNLIKGNEMIWGTQTNLVSIGSLGNNPDGGIRFADSDSFLPEELKDWTVKCETGTNADKYEFKLRLHFTEVTTVGDSSAKYVEWNLGEVPESGGYVQKTISGEAFYSAINNKLKNYTYEADVEKRVIGAKNIELIVSAANENLSLFMDINEPSTGVVTEQPIFTNVEGGVGIFASRFSKRLTLILNKHSTNVLKNGPLTSGYKFCVDAGWDSTPSLGGKNMETTYSGIRCN